MAAVGEKLKQLRLQHVPSKDEEGVRAGKVREAENIRKRQLAAQGSR